LGAEVVFLSYGIRFLFLQHYCGTEYVQCEDI
jgi:hypothetical protein